MVLAMGSVVYVVTHRAPRVTATGPHAVALKSALPNVAATKPVSPLGDRAPAARVVPAVAATEPARFAFHAPPATQPATVPVLDDTRAVALAAPATTAPTAAVTRPVEEPRLADNAYAASPTTAPATRPPVRKVVEPADTLTDEKIGAAITRGIDHLLRQFDPKTHLLIVSPDREPIAAGLDILCVYALMQCQQATNDPRLNPHGELMPAMIEAMKRLNLAGYTYETYARGLRATALALYNRPEDRQILGQDALALMKGSHAGGYTYTLARSSLVRDDGADHWDNSNSQYGLLGVWSAAEVGFDVPDGYWALVQKHWMSCQFANGQWDYSTRGEGEGTHSMTCAGLASLFVTRDYLEIPKLGAEVGRDPFTAALAKGLSWLERGRNSVALDHGAYDLYGLERVGLASGFKFFGKHEWYRELATITVANQSPRGGWGGDVETAYSLLFLSRGRHPVLMNKLRFDGYWANRPRDAANLARFVGYQLERPLNWQVVPMTRDWTEWADSPILYIASHKAIKFSEADYVKIRSYVENGGMLYMQADGGTIEFNRFAHEAAHKLFPQYEMVSLPPNHPLCSVLYKFKPGANLHIVTNGARILMLYAADDESKWWQARDDKIKPLPFQLGTNMFVYASGKRDLRNHLNSTYIPAVHATPSATYRLARLKYAGNWDPEPEAWHRFSRWFHLNTGYALNIIETPIKDLKVETAPIAHLTGTARYDLTAEEADALEKYVRSGGLLLVDLCGGTGAFDKSIQSSLFFKAFAGTPSHVISPSHPVLSAGAKGMEDLSKPVLRPFAIDVIGARGGMPEEIVAGKGHVLFTSLDITSGLLGTGTWGIIGYDPNYAQSLVKNAVLWAIDGQYERSPVANR